jgi:hypothetical protein
MERVDMSMVGNVSAIDLNMTACVKLPRNGGYGRVIHASA